MRKIDNTVELLRTPIGRYVWWHELQIVDFVFKGKSKGVVVGYTRDSDSLDKALAVAAKHLYSVTRRPK